MRRPRLGDLICKRDSKVIWLVLQVHSDGTLLVKHHSGYYVKSVEKVITRPEHYQVIGDINDR